MSAQSCGHPHHCLFLQQPDCYQRISRSCPFRTAKDVVGKWPNRSWSPKFIKLAQETTNLVAQSLGGRHQAHVMAERPELTPDVVGSGTGLQGNETGRDVGQ